MRKYLTILLLWASCTPALAQTVCDFCNTPTPPTPIPDVIRTQPRTPSGTQFNNSSVVDANLKARYTFYVPTGLTPTLNGGKDSSGAVFFSQGDTSINVRYNGVWVKFKPNSNAIQYPLVFGFGIVVPPSYYNGSAITNLAVDSHVFMLLPDGVVTGLTITASEPNAFVDTGSWRISGKNFRVDTVTTLTIDAQDATLSRYDLIYGNNVGMIGLVSGTASLSPVLPNLPDSSIMIGYVFIQPASISVVQPVISNYVTTNTDQMGIAGNKGWIGGASFTGFPFSQFYVDQQATFNRYTQYNNDVKYIGSGGNGVTYDNGVKLNLYNPGNTSQYVIANGLSGTGVFIGEYPYASGYIMINHDNIYDSFGNVFLKSGTAPFTLTTTGSSGAATLTGTVLNIPNYSAGGVSSFNTRTGAVTLSSSDVTTALGFTPENVANKETTLTNSATLYPSGSAVTAAIAAIPAGATGANPTATAGATAVNGSATTFMRSDAAPKVDSTVFQTILNFFPKGDTRYLKTTTAGTTYALQSTSMSVGNGILGGGSLATNRTFTLDTTIAVSKTFAARYLPIGGGTMTGTINTLNLTAAAANTYNIGTSAVPYSTIFVTTLRPNIIRPMTSGGLSFSTNGGGATVYAKLFDATGDWTFGSGTNTDNGYRVDLQAAATVGYIKAGTFSVDLGGGVLGTLRPAVIAETPIGALTDSIAVKLNTTGKLGAVPVSNFVLTSNAPIHGNSTTTGTATTAVTITIGSTLANTTYVVSITPRDLLTAVNYYISAQTTTTFTVTFVTALTGSINFDYIINR